MRVLHARYDPSVPPGYAMRVLRRARAAHGWRGLVEVHHVIPQSLGRHAVVKRYNYDVRAPYNLLLMPNRRGIEALKLRSSRPAHDWKHTEYNRNVLANLEACENRAAFVALLVTLHAVCRGRTPA